MPIALERLLAYADTYGSLIPLIAIIVTFYKKKMPSQLISLVWYLFLSIAIFGYSNFLADRGINNLLLYNIFAALELAILLIFFHGIIQHRGIKKWIVPTLFSFMIFWVFNLRFLERLDSFNSNVFAIEFMLIILSCFIYYYEFSNSDEIIYFLSNPIFWIVSGLFIYFSSTILIFVLYKYAASVDRNFVLDFWQLQVTMYLIKNMLIAKGVLCFQTQK